MAVTNDIIKKINKATGQPTFKTRAYLKAATDIIGQALQEGDKVELAHLGSFKLLRLPERTVETNFGGKKQVIKLAASITPDFELSAELKAQIKAATPDQEQPPSELNEAFRLANIHNRDTGVRFIELSGKVIPKAVLSLIPEPIARRYQAVPFLLEDKTLSVASIDPENEEAFNALRKASGKIIKPFLSTQEDISYVIDQYSGLQSELKELVADADDEGVEAVEEKEAAASEGKKRFYPYSDGRPK